MNFSYLNNTQIEFGQGQIKSISHLIPKDKKVLVIYGFGSIKKNGIYDQVAKALEQHQWLEFSGVEANPTLETMNKAVALARAEDIDFILAVGGGSVIDGAKYAAAAICYEGDGWDILEGKHTVTEAIPLAAILTIPATGSESNAYSVLTKAETQDKLPFYSDHVKPKFAVMDPDVMKTLPERQLANGVVDAWVHVCEQYLTFPTGALVQEGYAEALLKGLKTLGENFSQQDDQWRANLMWSANQALNGLIGLGIAQDWATHMIGHELTALYGVDHARSLAIIHPWLLRNQLSVKKAKLEQMGRNVFMLSDSEDLAEKTIQHIESFYQSLNVSTQLTEHNGSKEDAINEIIDRLTSHGMTQLGENEAVTLEESRSILEDAVA
jgi:NADP-dependent alcohol dehydrogenase